MSRRTLLLPLVVALALLGVQAAVWYGMPVRQWLFGPPAPASIEVSGTIEAHESVLSFTQVSAPVVALPFDEGAEVAAGTVLARLDDRLYRQQMAIDEAACDAAEAQVAVDDANLAATQQNVASDLSDLAQKQRDLARADALVTRDVVSRQAHDLAATAAQQSAAGLARDRAMVEVARNTIALAKADLATAQARVKADAVTLGYAVLRAPFAGVIAVRQAELGELAGPGVAIVTLDDLDHVWLRAYVNEPDLGRIRLDEAVAVTTDSDPGRHYPGRIAFISPEAEFTPKTVDTHAERVTLVYRIRIELANPGHALLPGMPADARIALLPAGGVK